MPPKSLRAASSYADDNSALHQLFGEYEPDDFDFIFEATKEDFLGGTEEAEE
jgi:hypothetical protein